MKSRISIYLFGLLFSTQVSHAQMSAGFKSVVILNDIEVKSGNVNLNNLIKPKIGYSIGGFASYRFDRHWEGQFELLFLHSGFMISEGTSINIAGFEVPVGATINTSIHYVELPILLKYIMQLGAANAFVLAGPNLNYALNGKVSTQINSLIDFNVNTIDLNLGSDAYNRFGIGVNIGAGLEFPISANTFITTEVRYTQDLNSQVEVPFIQAGVKNKGIGIGMGIKKIF